MLMERNVTSIMHFLLEDATHGHTWPRVRERWTGKRMRINCRLVKGKGGKRRLPSKLNQRTEGREKKNPTKSRVMLERKGEHVLEEQCVKIRRAGAHAVRLFM